MSTKAHAGDPIYIANHFIPGSLFRDRSHSNLSPNNTAPKRPSAVTIKKGIAVLNIHSKKRTRAHGFLSSIFKCLDKYGLSIDLISSSEVHVSLALHSEARLLSGGGQEEMKIESEALKACVEDLSTWVRAALPIQLSLS